MTIVGHIRPRADRPERLALYRADGRLDTTFARDQTRTDIAQVLWDAGYALAADCSVSPRPLRLVQT